MYNINKTKHVGAAARKAVDQFVKDSMVVGVGSGSTIECELTDRLAYTYLFI